MSQTSNVKTTASLILLVLAAGLLGTVGIAAALWNRLAPAPPLTITVLRLGLAAPFLFLGAWATARGTPLRPARPAWPLLGAMGLAMAVCQSLFFVAIPLAGVTLVVVISLCSAPLFVALLSIPLFGEHLSRRTGLALGLALLGTATLVLGGGNAGLARQPAYLWGALLALGSGGGYSGFILLSKIATRDNQMSSALITAVAFTLAAAVLVPFALVGGSLQLDLAPGIWLLALYMGAGPTALAYFLIQVALRSTTATAAAVVTLLEPAVAALLAWLLLGERMSLLTIGGAILLAGSVWLLAWRRSPSSM